MPGTRTGTCIHGAWLMAIAAVISLVLLLIAYFTPHGTIAHSWGALLVVVSTALMLIASLGLARLTMPHWLVALLEVLIVLDIAGTAVCAYFLESYAVILLMLVGLIGWIMHVTDAPRTLKAAP